MREDLQRLYKKLKNYIDRKLEEGSFGGGGSADWNVNDENGAGYIKNRPFHSDGNTVYPLPVKYLPDGVPYSIGGDTVLVLPETVVEISEEGDGMLTVPVDIEGYDECTVVWNGVAYSCTALDMGDMESMSALLSDKPVNTDILSDPNAQPSDFADVFMIMAVKAEAVEEGSVGAMVMAAKDRGPVTLSIYKKTRTVGRLPGECLPDTAASKMYVMSRVEDVLNQIYNYDYATIDLLTSYAKTSYVDDKFEALMNTGSAFAPVVFTTTELAAPSCNKYYSDCLDDFRNNRLGAYLRNVVNGKVSSFTVTGIEETDSSLIYTCVISSGSVVQITYNSNLTIDVSAV
ncbi:MAG: hypothetical protein IJN69_01360 [Oscillospiraceae bacterium]|nr:hypothetical protein [Oscillospiraceae bacterium]